MLSQIFNHVEFPCVFLIDKIFKSSLFHSNIQRTQTSPSEESEHGIPSPGKLATSFRVPEIVGDHPTIWGNPLST